MKNTILIIVLGISIFFSGCAPTYNIEPQYNENESTLNIEGKVFNNVKLSISKGGYKHSKNLRFKNKVKKYIFTEGVCEDIRYIHQSAGTKAYIWGNLEDLLRERFVLKNNGECLVEKISNVRFFQCRSITQRTTYALETRVSNQDGYSDLEAIFTDRRCYFALISHFKELAQKDEVKVKKYSHKNIKKIETKKEMRKYHGKYQYNGITKSCAKSGDVSIVIDGELISGSITSNKLKYALHGKMTSPTTFQGTISNGGTFDVTLTKNDSRIWGSYNLSQCYGTFNLDKK